MVGKKGKGRRGRMTEFELESVTFVTSLLPTRVGQVGVLYSRVVDKTKFKCKTSQEN